VANPAQTIYFGADHGGVALKQKLLAWFLARHPDIHALDLGVFSSDSVDYPDIATPLAQRVAAEGVRGVLLCGTGNGMAMTANKIPGIRAALVFNEYTGRMAKEHNNANIICLGGRTTSETDAQAALEAWFSAAFEGGRQARRLAKILSSDFKQ
jgi:RpiB/LacA/LacB family sugar-phosphate isomerase